MSEVSKRLLVSNWNGETSLVTLWDWVSWEVVRTHDWNIAILASKNSWERWRVNNQNIRKTVFWLVDHRWDFVTWEFIERIDACKASERYRITYWDEQSYLKINDNGTRNYFLRFLLGEIINSEKLSSEISWSYTKLLTRVRENFKLIGLNLIFIEWIGYKIQWPDFQRFSNTKT